MFDMCLQQNDTRRNQKEIDAVAEIKHRHGNSVVRVTKSIIYTVQST